MGFRIALLTVVLGFNSLASADTRFVLAESARAHLDVIQSSSYNSSTCQEILGGIQQDLSALRWSDYSNEELKEHARETADLYWKLRLAIHKKLDQIDRGCTMQVRNVFSMLRSYEDYLGEFSFYFVPVRYPEKIDFQKQPAPLYQHDFYESNLVHPDLNQTTLKLDTGDVLLARGVSFISAIITRVSDNLSGFSHALIWRVDPKTGEERSVESYVNEGVVTYSALFALKNENARLTVLRPKDSILGAQAAEIAYTAAKKRVPYDYKMDFNDDKRLSCVEVVTSSYEKASGGQLKLPLYPGQITVKSRDFLSKLGIKPGQLIAPVDLETDPRFELIADWRDMRIIRDSRHKDAILSEMLRWVDAKKYSYKNTTQSFIAKYILRPSRDTVLWPILHKISGASISSDMPKDLLGTIVVMKQVGEVLLKELRVIDQKYAATYGRPMTDEQLKAALEKFRADDLKRYNTHGTAEFHKMFNPF